MKYLTVAALAFTAVLLAGCAENVPEPPDRWLVEPLGTRADFRDVFFLDALNGWIVGGGHDIGGGIVGRTFDGGRTWRFRSGIVKPPGRSGSFHLNAIWFTDENTGFIAGDRYHILRTVDGGKHWHKMPTGNPVWAHLRDLYFVDGEHGWAIGNGGLARTTDGGATWEGPLQVDPRGGNHEITRGQAIHFADRDRGWLVGKFGLIRSTTDGGLSWLQVRGPQASEEPDLRSLDFADESHGWAVGNDGTILHTADGGKTWARQASGVTDVLMDVDFIDPSRGWAVGFDRFTGSSTVLWTADGGTTWEEQARVGSESMLALFALDDGHAWAVGEQDRRSDHDGSQKLLRYEFNEPER